MKNLIILVVTVLIPLVSMSQVDVFEKYSNNSDVTFVSVQPEMFQMIAKMGIDVNDAEAKAYLDMVKSITSFKTLVTEKKEIAADIKKWVLLNSSGLSELMQVKDKGVEVNFYVKEGSDSEHVEQLLIFVTGINKATNGKGVEIDGQIRNLETALVLLTGNIDLNQISKLTSMMDIPGGEHLKKS